MHFPPSCCVECKYNGLEPQGLYCDRQVTLRMPTSAKGGWWDGGNCGAAILGFVQPSCFETIETTSLNYCYFGSLFLSIEPS